MTSGSFWLSSQAKGHHEFERRSAQIDLAAVDAAVDLRSRLAGPDGCDFEDRRRLRRQNLFETGRVGSRLFEDTVDQDHRARRGLEVELKPELFFDGVEDGDAVGALLFKLAAACPLDVEVPGAFERGRVDDRLVEIAAGHVVDLLGEVVHGHVVARDLDVARAGTVRGSGFGAATGVDGGCRLLELRAAFGDAEHEGWDGRAAGVDDELEALREQGAEHELQGRLRGVGRDLGDDVEVVLLEPAWTALDVVAVQQTVRGLDEIDHGRVVDHVAVLHNRRRVEEGKCVVRAGVDIRDDEGRCERRLRGRGQHEQGEKRKRRERTEDHEERS
jgi:hypothetical protein